MKKIFFLLLLAIFFALSGCGKKSPQVTEWTQFQDQFFKVNFTYPKDWYIVHEPNRVLIYPSLETAEKFFTHDPRKPDGVQIIVAAERNDSIQDYKKYIELFQKDQEDAGFTVKPIEDAVIEGLSAKKVEYAGAYDEQTKMKSIRAATLKDSCIYYVQYAAFNDMYEPYKFIFDSVMASLILPKPRVPAKDPNAILLPVQETKVIKNSVLEVTVPENMNETYPAPKGDVTFMMNLKIYREDCIIDIDVRPAKKLTLEKVIEQNTKKITNVIGKAGTTTISGEKAQFFNYSLRKDSKSRIYFVVKNDKIYRIILAYYTPMEKAFLPSFEKIVASIRFK